MKDAPEASTVMSMTGFAATQGSFEGVSWTADIRAVNGRSLDLRLRVPDIDGLDAEIRKRCQQSLGRGNVTIQLKLQRDEAETNLSVNRDALKATLSLLSEIQDAARAEGLDINPVRASDIANMRGVLEMNEDKDADVTPLRSALLESLEACLSDFVADRAREGAALAALLTDQVDQIEALTAAAAKAAAEREPMQKANIQKNLARLLDAGDIPDEARVAQELAMLAVKTDVSEEIGRLGAHVDAARALLTTKGPVGRKLDFLMQEFNREANTLCSKAQSSDLTKIGLDLKTVIDQMREQVQNIE